MKAFAMNWRGAVLARDPRYSIHAYAFGPSEALEYNARS